MLKMFGVMENNDYISDMKVCGMCGETLPLDSFDNSSRDPEGKVYACKRCLRDRLLKNRVLGKSYYIQPKDIVAKDIPFEHIDLRDNRYVRDISDQDKVILNKIIRVIQGFYGVTLEEMMDKKRFPEYVFPRYHFYWFVLWYKDFTRENNCLFSPSNGIVGKIFGQDHAMVWHGRKVVDNMLDTDKSFKSIHDGLFIKIDGIISPLIDKREKAVKDLISHRLIS